MKTKIFETGSNVLILCYKSTTVCSDVTDRMYNYQITFSKFPEIKGSKVCKTRDDIRSETDYKNSGMRSFRFDIGP